MRESDNQIDEFSGFEGMQTRRDFLTHAALRIPVAAAVLAVFSQGCKKTEFQSQQSIRPQVSEVSSYQSVIPKMDFVEGEWFSAPHLPDGLQFSEVAQKVHAATVACYQEILARKPDATSFNGPAFPGAPIEQILLSIDPRFSEVFRSGQFQRPAALVDYFNRFLVRQGKYLFVEFKMGEANLYDVKSYGKFQLNEKDGGHYVELVNPVLVPANDRSGLVTSVMPNIVHLWPDDIKKWSSYYVSELGGDVASFETAKSEAVKRHEAGHVYLESLYPRSQLPPQIRVNLLIEVKPGVVLGLSGGFEQSQFHELYGLGIELATAAYVRIFAQLLSLHHPAYEVASSLMILYLAKFVSSEDFEKLVTSHSSHSATFSPDAIKKYIIEKNNVSLMNKVGYAMAEQAVNALKASMGS